MMGLGWQELLIVLIIVMIIFGAGKLTQVGSSLGRSVKEFKAQAAGGESDAAVAAGTGDKDESRGLGSREFRADRI
jgi:sec-independent protein translocase protein TatA